MDIFQLDSIQLPTLTHIIVTLIFLFISQWIDQLVLNKKREKLVHSQRELYFRKLDLEAIRMEEERLKEELKVAKEIESLRAKEDELKSQMASEDLEAYESDLKDNGRFDGECSDEESNEQEDNENEEQVQELVKELERVQSKADELQFVENNISKLESDIIVKEECDVEKFVLKNDAKLAEKIKELELENENLKSQLSNSDSSTQLIMQTSNLDPQILQYLQQHNDILTLPFLKKAHDRLVELKAVEPEKDFDAYIEELKKSQDNYNKRLAELRVSKRKVEIELKLMKEQYEKELASFNEMSIEHLLKNAGGSIYVKSLEDRNKLDKETIDELKRKLEFCRNELNKCRKDYEETLQTSNYYYAEFEKTQKELVKKKAELRERQFMFNPPQNVSSPSSVIGTTQVPPPPPIDIPSYEDFIKAATDSNQQPPLFNTDPNSTIPPPPALDMPIHEILRQCNP